VNADDSREMDRRNRETHRRGQDLAELQYHWGTAYRITFEAGQFCARRRDTGAAVRCGTAAGLHAEILTDYRARPVPRDLLAGP
jgi:hypothetical protein